MAATTTVPPEAPQETVGRDSAVGAPAALNTWSEGEYYILSFGVNRSRRYHLRMRAWYQGWHDLVLSLNAVLSAGAFVALVGGKSGIFVQIMTGVVAAGSAIDTVLGLSKKAALHGDLGRRFTDLAARMVVKDATPSSYAWASAERLRIEKDEPPIRRIVDLMAYNEEARSRGTPDDDMLPLSAPQRYFGYFFTFGIDRMDRRFAEQRRRVETAPRTADAHPPVPQAAETGPR